jgi:HK97 family phage major capsid protein
MGLAMLAVLALVAIVWSPKVALTILGIVPTLGIVAGDETEFQVEVLKGVDRLTKDADENKSRVDKVLADLDRSDKEVKKAMEELTKVKNQANDFDLMMKKMEKVQKAIALNARSSFKDPIERALANDETRAWLNAAARAMAFPGDYNKLPSEFRKLLEEGNAAMKSITGVDSGLGQATVPTATFNEIYDTLLEYGDWPSLGVVRVGARTNVLPVATARPVFYWIGSGTGGTGEGSAITAGDFTGSSVTLTIQTLAAYLLASRELLADSTVDLAPYILKQMAQTISFGLDSVSFTAAAAANQTDAGYTGIFQAALANTNLAATAAAGNTTVQSLQLEDFVNVLTTVSPIVLKRRAMWWAHPQIIARLVLIRDKNGRPIFQTWQEVPSPGAIGSVLGYPVRSTAAAPSTNSAGQPVLAFGDPDGMAIGIRSDLELATSDDIKFAENMRAFRALMRAGVKLKTSAASTTLKPLAVLTTAAA